MCSSDLPVPPVHHVWVAGPGDGWRLYRSTMFRAPGLLRLGIVWAIFLALLAFSAVADPSHDVTWLVVGLFFPVFLIILLFRRSRAQAALMTPGSVWATGFGANELLIVTPISTLAIDYAALRPPRVAGPAVLIQTRRLGSSSALPLELFPPDALAFLHQHTMQPS